MWKRGVVSGFLTGDRLIAIGLLVAALATAAGCGGSAEMPEERGVLFRGTGNEPGWNVEIGPTRTVFVTNYGQERHEFATPQPSVDELSRRTTYRARFDGHEILVELTRETCADTMSDETFPVRVRVEMDGRELRGCGGMPAD